MSGLVCSVCKGVSFYEDEGSSSYFCSRCNTQSQELFAESFDIEENEHLIARSGGILNRRYQKKNIQKAEKRKRVAVPDLEETLLVYQYALRTLTMEVSQLTKSTSLENIVKDLWTRYLERWHHSGFEFMPCILDGGAAEDTLNDGGKTMRPPLPTRRLLLGFLSLALRLERSWAIPADLVRWCKQGRLPFAGLWEELPEDVRALLCGQSPDLWGGAPIPTTTNVFFHTYILAESLGIEIPPLDAPRIARGIFGMLGCPPACWTAFCSISQLFRARTPLTTLDTREEHYPEHVMAMCIAAIKLQRNWMKWEYESAPGELAMPSALSELDLVPRADTEELLRRLRRTLMRTKQFARNQGFNRTVRGVSCELLDALGPPLIKNTVTSASPALRQMSLVEESQRGLDKALFRRLKIHQVARLRVGLNCPNERYFGAYLHYAEAPEDLSGLPHPQYALLLERCARHMQSTPGLLHALVHRIDVEMLAILNERKKASVFREVVAKATRESFRLRAIRMRKHTMRSGQRNRALRRLDLLTRGLLGPPRRTALIRYKMSLAWNNTVKSIRRQQKLARAEARVVEVPEIIQEKHNAEKAIEYDARSLFLLRRRRFLKRNLDVFPPVPLVAEAAVKVKEEDFLREVEDQLGDEDTGQAYFRYDAHAPEGDGLDDTDGEYD